MAKLRDSRGRKISTIIESRANKLIKTLKKEASKEVNKIATEEVNNTSNWAVSSNPSEADQDLFSTPINDRYSSSSLSVQDAMLSDSRIPKIAIAKDHANVSMGNINNLLKLSARLLYFEFGTLSHSEVNESIGSGKYSISDFNVWKNPYIKESNLDSKGTVGEWGFKAEKNKGRFNSGYMAPIVRRGVEKYDGIKPVRMYRGSMPTIEARIHSSFREMVNQAKGKM